MTNRFHIKTRARSSGQVIYENKSGADDTAESATVISGGAIVIHK
jgi:hypothetical protein